MDAAWASAMPNDAYGAPMHAMHGPAMGMGSMGMGMGMGMGRGMGMGMSSMGMSMGTGMSANYMVWCAVRSLVVSWSS